MSYTLEKINKQLGEVRATTVREAHDIPVFRYHAGECAGAEQSDFDDRAWTEFRLGDPWGGYDDVAWFRAAVTIPEHLRSQKLALRFLVGPRDGRGSTAETLLYVNGFPLQGIDVWHEDAWLPPEYARCGRLVIALKAWSGVLEVPPHRHFRLAQLVSIHEGAESYVELAGPLVKAAAALDADDWRAVRLLDSLNASYRIIDFARPRSPEYYRSLDEAASFLQSRLAELERMEEGKPRVIGVGHSHIDLAWLWRLDHTREKAARTFSTVLHLMRQYPEYRFVQSSPQLYKMLRETYPDIYGRVKSQIAAGNWEVTGGMWVEADTNVPGGESLVRQFLYGKRFMQDEFGVDAQVLWLPDCFGFTWTLPQIMKKCGVPYFMTTKLSWNDSNRFPRDTFHWRGIDGSEVLAHFVTTPEQGSLHHTYNGTLNPEDVKGIWDNYRQKDINDELLLLFGWGDGGGGPTAEMLKSARTLKNVPGFPKVEIGKAEPFFRRLESRLEDREVPTWDGELYLEYHRGTYTSQAFNKRANRRAELLYHDAEWLSALADILSGDHEYPATDLAEGWELILLNQFHDILPGSSIQQVYEDSRAQYAHVHATGEKVVRRAQSRLIGQIATDREAVVAFNSLGWTRNELLDLPCTEQTRGRTILDERGEPSPVQLIERDGEQRMLLHASAVPALGYRSYPLVEAASSPAEPALADHSSGADMVRPHVRHFDSSPWLQSEEGRTEVAADVMPLPTAIPYPSLVVPGYGQARLTEGGTSLAINADLIQSPYYRIEFNPQGQITRLFDRLNQREVLAPGKRGNLLQVFEDKPRAFDAWDIDPFYGEKAREITDLVDARVLETGPLRGVLRFCWRIYDSLITQDVTVYARSPRIDFHTEADWQEKQVLLKVAFPVDVRSTRATYDIQFGNIERPTHWNTSWDAAHFENVAHKWVDLSEGNYGVSLLNDCKYGHDVKDNVIRLTLIKSPIRPDATADLGKHQFTYSLLPHAGGWREGHVAQQAYELNYPLRSHALEARADGTLPHRYEFASLDAENVIIETVKQAESQDAWIVRVYENEQCRNSRVSLRFGHALRMAMECNLLEEEETEVEFHDRRLYFSIAPYEIKTFKVWFA